LHIYGKAAARDGRKMGHLTRLLPLGGLAGMPDSEALRGL
jgi:phosphoribosylaminoimidazole carboxylase (NCAIR synthetase)